MHLGPMLGVAQATPLRFHAPAGAGTKWYDLSFATLYQDAAGTAPVTADGDPVGLIRDTSGNGNDATQATASLRPLAKLRNGKFSLQSDFVDDSITVPNTLSSGDMVIGTPYGYQVSRGQQFGGVDFGLPLCWTSKFVVHAGLTAPQLSQVSAYMDGDKKLMVALCSNSVVDNVRFYSDGTTHTITAVGANGGTANFDVGADSNSSLDLGAAGLTTPALLLLPDAADIVNLNLFGNQLTGSIPDLSANTALANLNLYYNQLTGSIPDLSANTALANLNLYNNQLTGSIPDLSSNTALVNLRLYYNQLTGSIPDLSSNTALVALSLHNNQLTGSIPDLSANTALVNLRLYNNQLTGYAGGTVSTTLETIRLEDNLLTQSAVDAVLAAVVAAGRTSASGTCVLNIGGTGNAAPSASGLTDAATLVSRGWTVTTN